ncbi:unnamed protein product [Darwinula stevensoni]|uniref:OCIA domain-containing protein n=1 Tax=Darwinula stevensoni TaxID=69355 RepID=A0A7R9A378_9CRUS|nr:unnamed protein product [Darwinula stevensoni]CAG0881558.1 unnamed protein product [Darwinula stevensoni]
MSETGASEERNIGDEQRAPRLQLELSREELRALQECNRESFWYRSVPIASLLAASTHYLVKLGYLAPNPRFGTVPKVLGSTFMGYFIGKLSYRTKCEEKILQLPNSKLADAIRQRNAGKNPYSIAGRTDPDLQTSVTVESPSPAAPDFDRMNQKSGLDEFRRPGLEDSILKEESPPIEPNQTFVTYDDLRRQNREESAPGKGMGGRARQQPQSPSPYMSTGGTQPMAPREYSSKSKAQNTYGDVWEE